jgi:hypothetical protein
MKGRSKEMVAPRKSDSEKEQPTGEIIRIDWSKAQTLSDVRAMVPLVLSGAEVFGDGSEFIKDKDRLIGVPFYVLEWHFNVDPANGREYANVLVMTSEDVKLRFNDGSTGIYAQLKKVTEEHGVMPIACKFGLRRSDYTTEVNGKPEKSRTYYLAG